MRVYNSWSKQEYIRGHIPKEFKETAQVLTTKQIEDFSKAIDNYYQRIRRHIEGVSSRRIAEGGITP